MFSSVLEMFVELVLSEERLYWVIGECDWSFVYEFCVPLGSEAVFGYLGSLVVYDSFVWCWNATFQQILKWLPEVSLPLSNCEVCSWDLPESFCRFLEGQFPSVFVSPSVLRFSPNWFSSAFSQSAVVNLTIWEVEGYNTFRPTSSFGALCFKISKNYLSQYLSITCF